MKRVWLVVCAVAVLASGVIAATPSSIPPASPPASPVAKPASPPVFGPDLPPPPVARPTGMPKTAPSTPPAPPPPAPEAKPPVSEGRTPVGIEDLKLLFRDAPIIIQFQIDSIQGKPEVDPRLPWEVKCPVLEVVKGNLLPGSIMLHVDSVVRAFDIKRDQAVGKQFVAGIKPLGNTPDRRFQLVGASAFAADGKEAEALRKLAESETASGGAGGTNLELAIRPIGPVDKAFPVTGPKNIEIRLTNNGNDSATYIQQPMQEKDGKLYLSGQGMIRLRDTTGRIMPDKGTVVLGQVPPPPPKPALILSKASFVENIDLAKHFDLPEGRYTLVVLLATPDGRNRVASNGFSFQVGAVNLPPEAPAPTEARTTKPIEKPPTESPTPSGVERATVTIVERTPGAAKTPAVNLPDPAKYVPGKPTAGLAGLLKPSKAQYAVSEPVDLEFRLINTGPRTLAIDARLERALVILVQAVGESPDPRQVDQFIAWPGGPGGLPEERAYLREGAFWGQIININILPLKASEKYIGPTTEEISAGKGLTYERFAKSLFSFPKPGVYTVTATYTVPRPKPTENQPAPDMPKDWWIGELQTNIVTIQVGEPAK